MEESNSGEDAHLAEILQSLVDENKSLRRTAADARKDLKEAVFKRQNLLREFEALKVEKKLMKCGYEEMKKKYLECTRSVIVGLDCT